MRTRVLLGTVALSALYACGSPVGFLDGTGLDAGPGSSASSSGAGSQSASSGSAGDAGSGASAPSPGATPPTGGSSDAGSAGASADAGTGAGPGAGSDAGPAGAGVDAASGGADAGSGGGTVDAGGGGSSPVCTSGTCWTGGNNGSSLMHPGAACNACHSGGDGPIFKIAGTVYPTASEPTDCNGASGVTVTITDANGQSYSFTTNSAGNFSDTTTAIALPYAAKVVSGGKELAMVSKQSSGDCNSCHTAAGANGAPGRIMAP